MKIGEYINEVLMITEFPPHHHSRNSADLKLGEISLRCDKA